MTGVDPERATGLAYCCFFEEIFYNKHISPVPDERPFVQSYEGVDMPHPGVYARIKYNGPEDPRYPLLYVRVFDDKIPPERLVAKLKENGFRVEVDRDPTIILTVIAKMRTRRVEMIDQLVEAMKAWHDEFCGELQVIKTLYLQCDLPAFEMIEHTPAEGSPRLRVGLLKSRLRVAIELQQFEDAVTLRDEIKELTAGSLV